MSTLPTQFAKIVASPTDESWSQVYSAGTLFAVISLTKKSVEEDVTLNVIGKGIINNLEAEFFGLETKNLESIKNALESAIESTPEKVHLNLILTCIKDSTSYIFLVGKGEIVLKRNNEIGTILKEHTRKGESERIVHAGSGPLIDKDMLILKTPEFRNIIPTLAEKEALNTNSAEEAAEILSPLVHKEKNGATSALILTYSSPDQDAGATMHEPLDTEDQQRDDLPSQIIPPQHSPIIANGGDNFDHSKPEAESESDFFTPPSEPVSKEEKKIRHFPFITLRLTKKKRLYALITVAILLLLLGSLFITSLLRENTKSQKEFEKIYAEAQKEIAEAESLEDLNAAVAQDNYQNAEKILKDSQNKFKAGSKERQQIDELLEKIAKKTSATEVATPTKVKEVEKNKSPLLALRLDKKALLVAKNDDSDLFYLTEKAITSSPTSGEEKTVFDNDGDWEDALGLGAFGSNVYLLDRKEGLLKFVAGTSGYGKTSYLADGVTIDLKKAQDMTIDASVYILYSDGTVEKFTKGKKDDFTLSGLKKPLKSPTRIHTDESLDNIYILDQGNNRIVKIDKNGLFKEEFVSPTLKNALALDVSEKDNSIFVLAKDKVYELKIR